MQHISCIFCNTSNNSIVIQENGFNGIKCHQCNLIYISPRPPIDHMYNLYGHDQAFLPATLHINQEYPKRLHAKHTLSIIQRHCTSGSLLEIGAGAGYFLDEARKVGFNPVGLELNPQQAKFIQSQLKIACYQTPLEQCTIPTQTMDIVYHSDVLSHFFDPIQSLHTLNKVLKPNGFMIFETGNIADIDPSYFNLFSQFQYPDHLFFFGKESIKKLLELTGFNLIKYYSYDITVQLRFLKLVHSITKKNDTNTLKAPTTLSTSKSFIKPVKRLYHYGIHHMRYTLKTNPLLQKPQTCIIVAQKK